MRSRTLRGLLAHETHGEGRPVVFLHGLTFDRTTWRPIMDRLEGVRSVAVDLPGHGETGGPGCSVDEAAGRVGELIEALELERPVVVGHSIAAAVALIYASQHAVAGIVDVDSLPDIRPIGELVHQLAPALRGPGFNAVFEQFQQTMGFEHLDPATRAEVRATQQIDRDVVLAYWNTLIETDPNDFQAEIEQSLATVDAPCLAVFGHALADSERDHLRRLLPRVELEEWDRRGHFVHLAERDRFTARLHTFVHSVE